MGAGMGALLVARGVPTSDPHERMPYPGGTGRQGGQPVRWMCSFEKTRLGRTPIKAPAATAIPRAATTKARATAAVPPASAHAARRTRARARCLVRAAGVSTRATGARTGRASACEPNASQAASKANAKTQRGFTTETQRAQRRGDGDNGESKKGGSLPSLSPGGRGKPEGQGEGAWTSGRTRLIGWKL